MNKNDDFDNSDFEQKRTFIGVVAEYRLDDGSKGLLLLTDEGDEFCVIPDRKGKELQGYIDEEVVVTGFVKTDESGDTYVSIRGFDAIDYDEDHFGYDDDLDLDDDDFQLDDDDFRLDHDDFRLDHDYDRDVY